MIVIVDYGMGNLRSVEKALNYLDLKNKVSDNKNDIENSSGIVLPGVGSFEQGMINLKKKGLDDLLKKEVLFKKKPFFGICLGMQLIMEIGHEPIKNKGLGWIKGEVIPINNKSLPVPHLGWNNIYKIKKSSSDIIENNFYFIHSYHVVPNEKLEIMYTEYELPMVASIRKENIFGTQFHPEKSQKAGLDLINSFFK